MSHRHRFTAEAIHHSSFRNRHFPASLGTLFKGRDEFLAELRQHLTAEGPVVIKGKRAIQGMGGVGKTRAAKNPQDSRHLAITLEAN